MKQTPYPDYRRGLAKPENRLAIYMCGGIFLILFLFVSPQLVRNWENKGTLFIGALPVEEVHDDGNHE